MTTSRKRQKQSSKNILYNWMQLILQTDRNPKQNHRDSILPAHPQDVDAGEFSISDFEVRRNGFIFFDMQEYKEKMMARLNSIESRMIVSNISCVVMIGLTTNGKKVWQVEEERRKILIH